MFEILFLIGFILVAGFASRWAFERTKIPESVFLMGVGFILGPLGLLEYVAPNALGDPLILSLAPFVGALAIILVAFEGGMELDFKKLGQLSFSTLFSFSNLALSILSCFLLLHFAFGIGAEASILVAFILGGPSSFAITALVRKFPVGEKVRGILSLEGALSTAMVAVLAITAARLMSYPLQISDIPQYVVSSFSVSLVLGLFFGIVWFRLMREFHVRQLSYFVTLAFLFMLYFIDFSLEGVGVVSVIVAGAIIGNYGRDDKAEGEASEFPDSSFLATQGEVTLLIKTFFFVYIGIIFSAGALTYANVILASALVACLLLSRVLVVTGMRLLGITHHNEDFVLASMFPRGLMSASLATFMLLPVYSPPAGFSLELVFMVIFISNIATAFAIRHYERSYRDTLLFRKELPLEDGRKVTIRAFTSDDFRGMRAFINELVVEGALIMFDRFLRPIDDPDVMQKSIEKANRGECVYWVGEFEGRIMARAKAEKMEFRGRGNVSLSLYVAKEFRGQGL
ncbi:MAG: cation:proton antiporter, partial [Candidatus Micrarchaeota archaeon]|nr:cation:proton antiporter [Candidatus Micrarchaeota archaeon]